MTYVFRTKDAALVAALLVGVGNVYADDYAPSAPAYDNSCCEESCCECNFFLRADLLYWTACEAGFGCDFGSTSITNTVANGQIVTDISERDDDIDFNWRLGFRVGAGYEFSSCWDFGAYWTYYRGRGDGHREDNRAHWKLRFDEVDVLLGYKLQYNCFTLRPFFGARYAKIDQRLNTHLESTILIAATGASSVAVSSKQDKENFWGAGPVLGFEGVFDLGCGFSFYGNLDGNFLYGDFKSRFNDSDVFTLAVNNCNSHSKSCAVLTGYDAGFGFRYEFCWFAMQVGWEHHTYFDYNQIGCGGDLSLYGLDVAIAVRF